MDTLIAFPHSEIGAAPKKAWTQLSHPCDNNINIHVEVACMKNAIMTTFLGIFVVALVTTPAFSAENLKTQKNTTLVIVNKLTGTPTCPGGDALNIFLPAEGTCPAVSNLPVAQGSSSQPLCYNPGSPGYTANAYPIGIQINNWYPTTGGKKSYDNSCIDLVINPQTCKLSRATNSCWSGHGYPTDVVSNITSSGSNYNCMITVSSNQYTECTQGGSCSGTCKLLQPPPTPSQS
ncbi:MAG: hypothetical protein A3E82_02475 [Gammaproteobacteria bacterium RIFCSPHIGHO2_12_FULL_38_11]|nr:MAG: hypothetical protein A3E82_02475 [Gammaproteobacteria bacterium RIFCSPHIGHO2_12_FULL_38_11]